VTTPFNRLVSQLPLATSFSIFDWFIVNRGTPPVTQRIQLYQNTTEGLYTTIDRTTPTLLVGESQTYTIWAQNQGMQDAGGARVRDVFPAEFTATSASIVFNGGAPVSVPVADFAVGVLIPSWPVNVELTITIVGTYNAPGTIVNSSLLVHPSGYLQGNHSRLTDSISTTVTSVPVPATVLLMHMEGSNGSTTFTDEDGHTASLYHVGAIAEVANLTTTSPLMGSASLLAVTPGTAGAGSNIIVTIPTSTDFDLPGDFTIEYRHKGVLYPRTAIGLSRGTMDNGVDNLSWYFYNSLGDEVAFSADAGNIWLSGPAADGSAHAYAVTREGTTLRLYIDGTLRGTRTNTAYTFSVSGPININGPYQTVSTTPNYWNAGRYDEIRITKNLARYTGASYTPSATPFTYPDLP
jgi:uncharacterized repeat protein (TIGR01451 family)